MSAPQMRRRPPQSEGQPIRGHIKISHDQIRELGRLTSNHTEVMLILRTFSDSNQRHLDGSVDKWTGIEQSEELAQCFDCTPRTVNLAIEYLTREDVGVLERRMVKEALRQKLVRPVRKADEKDHVGPTLEGATRGSFGYILRARIEAWPALPSADDIAIADAAKRDAELEQQKLELAEDSDSPVLHLHDEPLLIMPGAQARPITLSDEVRRRLGRCAEVKCSVDFRFPVSLDFRLDGDSLHCAMAESKEARAQRNLSGKNISPTHFKGVTDIFLTETLRLKLHEFGITFDAELGLSVVRAFREGFPETGEEEIYGLAGYIAAKRKEKGRGWKEGLAVKLAAAYASILDLDQKATAKQETDRLSRETARATESMADEVEDSERVFREHWDRLLEPDRNALLAAAEKEAKRNRGWEGFTRERRRIEIELIAKRALRAEIFGKGAR